MAKLRASNLIFLDVETTGLYPAAGDRIVELGMIACQGRRKKREYSQLFDPEIEIPEDAEDVHGISDEDVEDAPLFSEHARRIGKMLNGAWIVGHCTAFDMGFLNPS